ncbi:MAG: hypothetical protein P4M09_17860 [Devosia sp.]|nr:hypothetical protein [Devosia sp.]
MSVLKAVQDVTDRIAARSAETRRDYLNRIDQARSVGVMGRELFAGFRSLVGAADRGASVFGD